MGEWCYLIFSTNGILRHCRCANFFGTYFFFAYDTIGDSNFYASNRGVLRSIHHHFHYVLSRVFSVLQISLRTIAWLFLTTGYRVVFSVHYHHVLSRGFAPCIFSLHVPSRHFPTLISSLPPGRFWSFLDQNVHPITNSTPVMVAQPTHHYFHTYPPTNT